MLLQSALLGLLTVWVFMTALWLLSLALKDSSIVDIAWGPGFVVLAWLYLALGDGFTPRSILLVALVTVWGVRLGVHIFLRNRGKGEDFRYAAWRKEHGTNWWWRSYLQVFLLQGIIMFVVAAPLLVAQASAAPASLTLLDVAAAMLWTVGFFFEAVGDAHLVRFKRDPANKGKLLTAGVWSYTRHPNYFGDAAQWWAFYLIALAAGGWWTVFGPALMTFLLVRVSGVAMLERSLKDSKPGYEDYVRTTSAFLPRLPAGAPPGM